MNSLKIFTLLVFSSLIISSCGDDDTRQLCDNSNSPFQSLFQSLITSGHTDDVTFDTEIHEYTFTLSSNKEVCEIGYQSQPGIASTAYVIEIFDNLSSTVIYSDLHTFSSTGTSYVTPTSVINLQSGVSYTIKRIQTNWGSNFSNIIGRLARNNPMNFPYTNGIMTITNADFYQNGGPLTNLAVPYIDIILK